MTNDETNRYIHVEIMGQPCWHEWGPAEIAQIGGVVVLCKKCKVGRDGDMEGHFNPDYCSDASPRSLLNEVVAKVREENAWANIPAALHIEGVQQTRLIHVVEEFGRRLLESIFKNNIHHFASSHTRERQAVILTITPAEQIARACVEAHKTTRVDKRTPDSTNASAI